MSEGQQYSKVDEIVPQQQLYPGLESQMQPRPKSNLSNYQAASKLQGKVAIITGGDSGIGRAVAIAFAMEGADVAIIYNISDSDAEDTSRIVEHYNRRCLLIKADVTRSNECRQAVTQTIEQLGKLNILVNNAAYASPQPDKFEELSEEEWQRTFETNIYGYFYIAQAAIPHLKEGDTIINTGSTTGIVGQGQMVAIR